MAVLLGGCATSAESGGPGGAGFRECVENNGGDEAAAEFCADFDSY